MAEQFIPSADSQQIPDKGAEFQAVEAGTKNELSDLKKNVDVSTGGEKEGKEGKEGGGKGMKRREFIKKGAMALVLKSSIGKVLGGILSPDEASATGTRGRLSLPENAESFPDGIPVEYYLDDPNYFDNDEFTQNRLKIRESTRASQKDILKAFEVLRRNGVRIVVGINYNHEYLIFERDGEQGAFGTKRRTAISSINPIDNFIEDLLYVANKLLVEENEGTGEIEILGIPRGFEFTVTNKARGFMSEEDLQYTGMKLEAVVAKWEEYMGSIESDLDDEDLNFVKTRINGTRKIAKVLLGDALGDGNLKAREDIASNKDGLRLSLNGTCNLVIERIFNIYAYTLRKKEKNK